VGADLRRGCAQGASRLGGRGRPADRGPGALGLVPTPVALAGFVLEVVAHTHDVAAGIGRTDLLDERLGHAALGIAERFLPAALRGSGAVFAEPVAVPATAGSYERLAAFLGRAPG